ncbi:MAG: hypothetical protein DRP11_00540 [Candidatus Aenigmatarchaeota archaeon]|nr:MAG: hypothetical protein DRP11_00540 [Candidatus Aenigmarchaeota archaeon]
MIVVDTREASKNPDIVRRLKNEVEDVEIKKLPVGDYLVVGSRKAVLVERKTSLDFVHSVSSRRMVDQLILLSRVTDVEPRILIEGSLALIEKFSRWSPEGVMGSVISVVEDWKIPVIFVPSKRWTVIYLAKLHRNLGKIKKKIHPIRVQPKVYKLHEKIRACIEGIPGIGPNLAHEILLHFGSIRRLSEASPDEISQVKGVGRKRAEEIHRVLNARYMPEE